VITANGNYRHECHSVVGVENQKGHSFDLPNDDREFKSNDPENLSSRVTLHKFELRTRLSKTRVYEPEVHVSSRPFHSETNW